MVKAQYGAGPLCGLLLCCALLLCSCAVLGPLPPPGFSRTNDGLQVELPEGCGNEVAYSLLSWRLAGDSCGEKPMGGEHEALERLSSDIFAGQSSQALRRFAPLLRLEAGIPTLDPMALVNGLEADRALDMLREIASLYSMPAAVEIPIEACLNPRIWRRHGRRRMEEFRQWAERTKSLPLDEPGAFDRRQMIREADYIAKLIDLKQNVQSVLDAYDEKVPAGMHEIYEALDWACSAAVPLEQGFSMNELGYGNLQRHFLEFKAKLSLEYVLRFLDKAEALSGELARLLGANTKCDESTEKFLDELEDYVDAELRSMQDDERFKFDLSKNFARAEALLQKMGRLRHDLWTGRIAALGREQRYWDAYLYFRRCLSQSGALSVYAPVIRRLPVDFGVGVAYIALLPDAMKKYGEASRQAMEIANKPSVAYAICSMMHEMCSVLDAGAAEQLALLKDVERQLEHSRARMLDTAMRRKVLLGDMASATPGIGVTYKQDLENELARLLDAFGMPCVCVVHENAANSASAEYLSLDGNVANFDGEEVVERPSVRQLTRLMECRRVENPDYAKEAEGTDDRRRGSRVLYQQDKILQVIRVREIERLAHIRVLLTFKGPGFSMPLELNEFYSRLFHVEESHPISDVKLLDSKDYYDAKDVPKADAAPQLLNDRVWTPGQMLDWARRDSIGALALMMFLQINGYPLYLRSLLEGGDSSMDAEKKAELWAQCSMLCDMQRAGDELELLNCQAEPIAKAYGESLAQLRQQRLQILELRGAAAEKMRQAAYEYIQGKEVRQ